MFDIASLCLRACSLLRDHAELLYLSTLSCQVFSSVEQLKRLQERVIQKQLSVSEFIQVSSVKLSDTSLPVTTESSILHSNMFPILYCQVLQESRSVTLLLSATLVHAFAL